MKRIALVLPVLLVAACGGGSEGLSKSDYLSQAEAICKKANADIDAIGTPSSLAEVGPTVDKFVTTAEDATADLEALDPPKDDEAELKSKFLEPLGKQVDEGKAWVTKIKDAAAANDQAKVLDLLDDDAVTSEPDLTWMKDYGFKDCVETAKKDE